MEEQPSVIGVVGLGAVGEPLLRMLYETGHEVIGIDSDSEVLARVDRRMKAAGQAATGGESPGGVCTLGKELNLLSRAGLIIEAIPEDLSAKSELLYRLGTLCPRDTVLVTTTTTLSLHLAIASGWPTRVMGLRLLLPPAPGSGVETVAMATTQDSAVQALNGLVTAAGLKLVDVGARPGADATALVYAYLNRAVALCASGYATRDGIDTAMRLGCGLPAGPLETLDRIGLDTVHASLVGLHGRTGDASFSPAPLLGRMVAGGALGRKCGQGFYAYDDLGEKSDAASAVRPATGGRRAIRKVGVVGSGVMARGIAEVMAVAGHPTMLVARSREKADRALEELEASLAWAVRRGRVSADARASALTRIRTGADLSELGDCDLVIEAVAEDLDVKRTVFAALGSVCRSGAVLATTTSSLPVRACADASGRPSDVVGTHFFNPVPAMSLVELVRAPGTSDDTAVTVRSFCESLGKTTVECPDRTGFIVNYLLFPYLGDAVRLLDQQEPTVVGTDAAVERGFGYPMGPFKLMDTIGLDISLAIMRRLHSDFSTPEFAPPELLERLVSHGCLGRKSGQGFHLVNPSRALERTLGPLQGVPTN